MIRTLIALAVASALASPCMAEDADSSIASTTEFAKIAFAELYSMPRPPADIAATRGIFADAEAFSRFVEQNYKTPFSGFLSIPDMSMSFAFPEGGDGFEKTAALDDFTMVRFNAIQRIVVADASVENCYSVEAYVVSGTAYPMSIAEMKTTAAPMSECER